MTNFNEIIKPDSNACSLAIKNFGALPNNLNGIWSSDLTNHKSKPFPFPKRLVVELLNSCNLDCPMCRVGRYGVNLKRKLPLNIFEDLVSGLADKLELIRINGLGESTLLPDFAEYVNLILRHGLTVELITNGSGEIEDYELILKNKGILLISWDAGEKHRFEVLRRPASWESYTNKLVEISNAARLNCASDRLFLLFTLQKQNIDQLPILVERCREWDIKNILVNVVKSSNDSWIAENLQDIKQNMSLSYNIAKMHGISLMIPDQIGGNDLSNLKTLKTSGSDCCTMPYEEAAIRWNGDVQVCNMFNPYIYGNLYLQPFDQIWNNKFAQIFRKHLNLSTKHPYCLNCVYMRDSYHCRKV